MHFHICLIQPRDYPHTGAFAELVELIRHGLEDLGCTTSMSENNISGQGRNIVVGCHLLDPSLADRLPPSTVILNTEPLYDDGASWNPSILHFTRRFETWDYSLRNVEVLSARSDQPVKLLPIGYHEKLRRIDSGVERDIDVLFYGVLSEPRRMILEELADAGIGVKHIFGVYGGERDALIARAKVVLNLHKHHSQIFEIVRVFYLMINSKVVASEVNSETSIDPRYLEGIVARPRRDLVDACRRLIDDENRRQQLEARALHVIQRMPQAELMAPLIES